MFFYVATTVIDQNKEIIIMYCATYTQVAEFLPTLYTQSFDLTHRSFFSTTEMMSTEMAAF